MSGNAKALFASGSDAALDALLSQTRAAEPEISEALTARILAEAGRIAAERKAQAPQSRAKAGGRAGGGLGARLGDWMRLLGGVPAAAAFCAALGLGAAAGAAAPAWTASASGQTASFAAALEEEDPLRAALQVSDALDLLSAENPLEGS